MNGFKFPAHARTIPTSYGHTYATLPGVSNLKVTISAAKALGGADILTLTSSTLEGTLKLNAW